MVIFTKSAMHKWYAHFKIIDCKGILMKKSRFDQFSCKRSKEFKESNIVTTRKAIPLDFEYLNALQSTLSEWDSQNDKEAYKQLR